MFKKIFLIVCFILAQSQLSSCLINAPENKSLKASIESSSSSTTPEAPPGSLSTYTFLQLGSTQTTSALSLNKDFADFINLRGKDVHNYLAAAATNTGTTAQSNCIVSVFKGIGNGLILILPLREEKFFNAEIKAYELFFQISSVSEDDNKNFCQKSGLIAKLSSLYPNANLIYSVKSVCSNLACPLTLSSQALQIFSQGGDELEGINTKALSFIIKNETTNNTGTPKTCTTMADCQLIGTYDCCLQNQCVVDKAIRKEVNQSSTDFLAAASAISINSNLIYDYPQFYYLCPENIPTDGDTGNSDSSTDDIATLKELYDSTTPLLGEMALCTTTVENASAAISAATTFNTGNDDRNFKNIYGGTNISLIPSSSIVDVYWGGVKLDSSIPQLISSTYNDDLVSSQKFTIASVSSKPSHALNDTLKIIYKIDGSCQIINSSLFQCYKVYVQGQELGYPSDHASTSKVFKLPLYADLSMPVVVTVDSFTTQENNHWQLASSALNKTITFNNYDSENDTGMELNDDQVIKITYYTTDTTVWQCLGKAKAKIEAMCGCEVGKCYLAPVLNSDQSIKNYECKFLPGNNQIPAPLEKTYFVESKNIPLRYFDSQGVAYDAPTGTTKTQEGNLFEYLSNENLLKPNNTSMSSIIGFNEIYGSIKPAKANSAKAPVVVPVTVGKQYDLTVNSGSFSPCTTCGIDYYSSLNKIFPANFSYKGGGYSPSPSRTERKTTNTFIEGNYRSDDLLFGRACFVPATMIPWTHSLQSNLASSHRLRMKAQHFLFANGYNRDWYGFDYGSLIGSFDGLTWFSLGNNRRVKATSPKLFLAVNAYFADQTQKSTFSVNVSEVIIDYGQGTSLVSTDFESDGAECQKYHVCTKDADCITQLGWDYVCLSVANIKTPWPRIDPNGNEVINMKQSTTLTNLLVGGFGNSQQGKRCVYRGRGAPCTPSYNITRNSDSYAESTMPGINACAPNYYCQSFKTGNVKNEKFNNRISRYGKSPLNQNQESTISSLSDIFGLGARIIGRPYAYQGEEALEAETLETLSLNGVTAICLPGKDLNNDISSTYVSQHKKTPSIPFLGDRVLGIGMSGDELTTASPSALSQCGILNDQGNYLHLDPNYYASKTLDSDAIKMFAGTQAFSSNLLDVFYNANTTPNLLVADTNNTGSLEAQTLERHRCLKAPGSPCFSDFDCAPSSFISGLLSTLDASNSTLFNPYELTYWKQELTCANRYFGTSAQYKLSNNRCCRAIGKTINLYANNQTNPDVGPGVDSPIDLDTSHLPQIDIASNSFNRYSATAPAYMAMKNSNPKSPEVQVPAYEVAIRNQCKNLFIFNDYTNCRDAAIANTSTIAKRPQFLTLDKIASNTCCGGNWVRNFNVEDNGGGHKWSNSKVQTIPKEGFRCLGWTPYSATAPTKTAFSCNDPQFQCNAKNLDTTENKNLSNFLSSLELLGIPQVMIKTTAGDNIDGHVGCYIGVDYLNPDTTTVETNLPSAQPIPGTIRKVSLSNENEEGGSSPWYGIPEYKNSLNSNTPYFAADDIKNFDTRKGLHKIFSADTFSCCLPSGEIYDFPITDEMCCTGQAFTDTSSQTTRCCLPNYTNVSIYLNRYVSSEGNSISWTQADPLTGTLPSSIVSQIAQTKNLCCSGNTMAGNAISSYPVPGSQDVSQTRIRFLYLNSDSNSEYYDLRKVRWNTNIYCVPSAN